MLPHWNAALLQHAVGGSQALHCRCCAQGLWPRQRSRPRQALRQACTRTRHEKHAQGILCGVPEEGSVECGARAGWAGEERGGEAHVCSPWFGQR